VCEAVNEPGEVALNQVCKNLAPGRHFGPEAVAKPVFLVILNEVKDLKLLKIRDSSLRPE
jgi:hypothetical protein